MGINLITPNDLLTKDAFSISWCFIWFFSNFVASLTTTRALFYIYLLSGACATLSWGRTRWIGALIPFSFSSLLVRLPIPISKMLIMIVYNYVRVLEFRLK